jgi:hypothetical protein
MRSAITLQETITLLALTASAVTAIALGTSSEAPTRQARWMDRGAGTLGIIVSTALVLMAAAYAIPNEMAWP